MLSSVIWTVCTGGVANKSANTTDLLAAARWAAALLICIGQNTGTSTGMSQQMVEVGLAAVGEDLQAVAEALHTCQAAHAQVIAL